MVASWKSLEQSALAEVEFILASLPEPLRLRAETVPVVFERRPSAPFVAEGIEADSLGLFRGMEFGTEDQGSSPVPPQIYLYLENLWEFAAEDEAAYRAEVRTTYLHELGHYLGLDEDDLTARGLD